jgi:hypothetical protein
MRAAPPISVRLTNPATIQAPVPDAAPRIWQSLLAPARIHVWLPLEISEAPGEDQFTAIFLRLPSNNYAALTVVGTPSNPRVALAYAATPGTPQLNALFLRIGESDDFAELTAVGEDENPTYRLEHDADPGEPQYDAIELRLPTGQYVPLMVLGTTLNPFLNLE